MIQALVGAAMMCAIYYVLVYLQIVRGVASSSAGLYLIFMAVGMSTAGLLSGRLTMRGWSARTFTLSGTATTALAFAALARLSGTAHAEGVRAFVSATDVVFWSGAALMALAAILAVRLPRPERPENTEQPSRQPEPVPA
ncbi:hypothetical protein [Streptomyces sp. NPDC050564]|uniref:hypothetical protein n=1 Tax=Streptomyces sp. NPDC050564 TaxID=3365631 RepID=UPI0037A52D74